MKDSFSHVRTDEKSPIWEECVRRRSALYSRGNAIRSEFERDYTRLLHCEAYRRLRHKTQVFYAPQNDHICTRMEHVGHVASVSGAIAKYFGLNTELTQAIAIGHDIGHAPFGHTGEDIINDLIKSKKRGKNAPRPFWHERNSLFFADYIETLQDPEGAYENLNLTYAVRDGLICHCGEIDEQGLRPRGGKPIDLYDIRRPGAVSPFTWEGCVVKASDKIAFLGRDLEDARTYHILDMACYRQLREIVAETLGLSNNMRSGRSVNTTVLMNDMIVDLCAQSSPERGLCFSEPYFKFIKALKDFSFAYIYDHWRLSEFKKYARVVLTCVYDTLMKLQVYAQNRRVESALRLFPNLRQSFGDWLVDHSNYDPERKKIRRYLTPEVFDVNDNESYEKCVIEYISGMTDQFAIKVYEEIICF